MSEHAPGSVLDGRFRIEERIGVGGMATVYRALDQVTNGQVAVKILSREFLARNPKEAERNLRRFRREGDILKLLAGEPHVVQFIDQGTTPEGDHYIAMELLVGEQLRFHIGRGRSAMGLRTFAYHARLITKGLMGIHAKNLVHRDLAPDNIFVVKTKEGLPWPKFLDFGIGKSLVNELDQVTQMLTIMGKPQYFSPEQARGQELSAASDVYALAVVLYEMVTGYVPLEIHGIPDLRKIQKDPPIPISNYREGLRLPQDLRDVIMRCLAKKAEERPVLADVLAALDRLNDRLDAGEEFSLPDATAGGTPTSTEQISAVMATNAGTTGARTPSGVSREFQPGDAVGRFEVKQKIGRGGMGAVYLAWDPVLHRDVAIKVASRVEDEKARKEVLREARASSHLSSENIVTIFDSGTDARGAPYIAMEYVKGRTLADIIEDEGTLVGERFWTYARCICDAMIYAHENPKPVIHRDLKPANILCSGDSAKITDFGIAKVTAPKAGAASENTGSVGGGAEGSVPTMSPEQASDKPVDHRSDIYSLGCVFYMMATGHGPFQGNQIAILYQHATKIPDPPQKVNPKLEPVELGAIILKCLEKDPAKRFQSVREIKTELERLFVPQTGVARPWYRSPVVLGSVAAALLATAITVWVMFFRPKPQLSKTFELMRVGSAVFRANAAPEYSYVTIDRDLECRVVTPTDCELVVTVKPEGGAERPPQVFPITAGDPQVIKVQLGGESESMSCLVSFARKDNPEQPPTTLKILYDNSRPVVRFKSYGAPVPEGKDPIRLIMSKRHLTVLLSDPAGFDDEGAVKEVELLASDNKYGRVFTELRMPPPGSLVRDLAINASDRAGNKANQMAHVEFVIPAIDYRSPLIGHATKERKIPVHLVARLPDPKKPIPGIDANDINLGPGRTFDLRVRAGVRVLVDKLPLERRDGGYFGEINLPPDLVAADTDLKLDVMVDDEVIDRPEDVFTFKTSKPVIAVECGGLSASSGAADQTLPEFSLLSGQSLSDSIKCRINDDPRFRGDAAVTVTTEPGTTTKAVLDADGGFRLAPVDAEKFTVRIHAADPAGNAADLAFKVVRKGLQITAVRLGDRVVDEHGRAYVTAEGPALSVTALDIGKDDAVFAGYFDITGAMVGDVVRLDRSATTATVWETAGLSLRPGGATNIRRQLKLLVGKSRETAQPYPLDMTIVFDREPPRIEARFGGANGEILAPGAKRAFSAWRPITIHVTDNVGVADLDAASLVTIKSTGRNHVDPTVGVKPLTDSAPVEGVPGLDITLTPPERPAGGSRHEVTVTARDRAGQTATHTFTLDYAPVDVKILDFCGDTDLAAYGTGPDSAKAIGSDAVTIKVKPPSSGSVERNLLAQIFPGRAEKPAKVESFRLAAAAAGEVAFSFTLPRATAGSRVESGRVVFSVQDAGTSADSAQEIATVYYLLDSEPPTWELLCDGEKIKPERQSEIIKVSKLSSLKLVAGDGRGSGFVQGAFTGPAEIGVSVEIPSKDRLVVAFADTAKLVAGAVREFDCELRDAAGNRQPIKLKIALAKDLPEVALVAADKPLPALQDHTQLASDRRLRVKISCESPSVRGVRVQVRQGDQERSSVFVPLTTAGKDVTQDIDLGSGATDGAEFDVRYFVSKQGTGDDPNHFHQDHVRLDLAPPTLVVKANGRVVPEGGTVTVAAPNEIRIEAADGASNIRPQLTVQVKPLGFGAGMSDVSDGGLVLLAPETKPGERQDVTVTATDLVGHQSTISFSFQTPAVEVRGTTPTPPPTANLRTLTNDAIRHEDERRSGLTFVPVSDRTGGSSPDAPLFYMSQAEVTNAQFLAFADALNAGTIPDDLAKAVPRLAPRPVKDLAAQLRLNTRLNEIMNLPVRGVDSAAAQGMAVFAGGRLPTVDEWAGAAGKYLRRDADWPVYIEDNGSVQSDSSFMQKEPFAVFGRGQLVDVNRLLERKSNCPFGIVGLPGNAAEWAMLGRTPVAVGGSCSFPASNELWSPKLSHHTDSPSVAEMGIRVVWPKAK